MEGVLNILYSYSKCIFFVLKHRQKALFGSVYRHASWIERHAGLRDSSAAPAAICPNPGSAGVK